MTTAIAPVLPDSRNGRPEKIDRELLREKRNTEYPNLSHFADRLFGELAGMNASRVKTPTPNSAQALAIYYHTMLSQAIEGKDLSEYLPLNSQPAQDVLETFVNNVLDLPVMNYRKTVPLSQIIDVDAAQVKKVVEKYVKKCALRVDALLEEITTYRPNAA
jgi:hypothetical protein